MGEQKRLRWNESIRAKLFYSFVIVVFVPSIIIGLSAYFLSLGILKDKVSNSFSQTVRYISSSVEKELNHVKQFSEYLFVNKDIKKVLITDYSKQGKYKQLKDWEAVDQVLQGYSVSNMFRSVIALKLFSNEREVYSYAVDENTLSLNDTQMMELPVYRKAIAYDGKPLWASLKDSHSVETGRTYGSTLSVYRAIKDADYSAQIGMLYIEYDRKFFTYLLDKLDDTYKSELFIINNYGEIVNKPEQQADYDRVKPLLASFDSSSGASPYIEDSEGKNLILKYKLADWDWSVVGLIPLNELTRDNHNIITITVEAVIIGILLACIVWYIISGRLVRPIRGLMQTMAVVQEGRLDVKAGYVGNDEIGRLGKSFNYMLERINALFAAVIAEHSKKKDAEYRALQAQIHPHFLFNTLNTVRWMAIIHKADNIKQVVDALARLLRYSTGRKESPVTVQDELKSIEDYVYIQKLAYGHKFEVNWQIDEQMRDCSCIQFLLQPLVENAIFHGIEPKEGLGTITIEVRSEQHYCLLSVIDDGIGMSQEQLGQLLLPKDGSGRGFGGMGIYNVNERIKHAYGEEYGLTAESIEGIYTVVTARLPLEKGSINE
ncbi:sensor histidine kinase [Paenibacillus sp. GCM10027626]|uniref:cache domain-containing sensor histidine kinase n=1 Tax=Paenibacillus sp. GCM10027626 TaxID=3273411 RepID=UPI00363847E7